jgi:hypothetical protein
MMHPFLIVNPRSGRGRHGRDHLGADLERLRRAFADHGLAVEVAVTERPGHATELARNAGGDPVVAVGGDGTVHEVLQGLDLQAQRLGIIPAGSGDDFAWQHGLGGGIEAAVARIAAGRERLVDVGQWEAGRFHNNLGFGFEAEVNRLSHRVRIVRGPALYFVALARALATLRTYELEPRGRRLPPRMGRRLVLGPSLATMARCSTAVASAAPSACARLRAPIDGALDLLTVGCDGAPMAIITALGPVLTYELGMGRWRRSRADWPLARFSMAVASAALSACARLRAQMTARSTC